LCQKDIEQTLTTKTKKTFNKDVTDLVFKMKVHVMFLQSRG